MSSSSESDEISRWAEIGASYENFQAQGDIQSCLNLVKTICEKVPEIGQFVSICSKLISEKEYRKEFEEINKKLNKINKQLFDIDDKVTLILDKVKEIPHIIEYKKYLDKLHQLQDSYDRHVREPTSDTTAILKQKCVTSDMYDFIMWCNREVKKNSLTPLIKYMMEGYHQEKFLNWANMIMVHVKQAVVLHIVSVCMRCENTSDMQKTLNSDVKRFNECLDNIEGTFTNCIKEIHANYWKPAQEDIELFLRDNFERHNGYYNRWDLPKEIFKVLEAKYPWRNWVVVTWYYEAREGELMYDDNFGRLWKRGDRYILVTSQEKGSSELTKSQHRSIVETVERHAKSFSIFYRGAGKVASNVRDELKSYSIRDLVCFQYDNGFRPLLGPWQRKYCSKVSAYDSFNEKNSSIYFYEHESTICEPYLMLLVILK